VCVCVCVCMCVCVCVPYFAAMAPTGGGAGRVALWLATQFDRMLDFCLEHCKCCESMMLYMGAPLVVFGVLLIVSVIKIGMYDVLPLVVTPYSFVHWVHIMWAMLLSVNVLWNYYMGVFTDPGSQYSDHYKRLCKEAREMGLLQEEQDQRQQQQQQQQQQGQMPADYNIDLFGVKKDPEMLRRMRLAEVKHGRLAMLAAAAWPLQELFDPALANLLKVAPLLTQDGRNPDVLNGGDLQQISPLFWSSILGATITLELLYGERGLKGEIRIENADMIARGEAGRPVFTEVSPGDLGFDPLMLYPDDRPGQLRAQAGEINNGRLAMIALVTFVLSEYFTGKSIVELTPQFFTPIGQ